MKKLLCLLLSFLLLLSFVTVNAAAIYSYENTVAIASGVTLTTVKRFYSDYNISFSYIKADIKNEHIDLSLLTPETGIDTLDTVGGIAASNDGTLAALNADFFSTVASGKALSLGIEIKDGKLLQSPINPSSMATVYTDNEGVSMSYLDFHIMAVAPNGSYNEVRHLNKHTSYYGDILMYTSDFNGGMSPAPGGEVCEVVVEDGKIKEFRRNMPSVKIPENGCVLVVSEGASMFFPNNFNVGDDIKFDYYITPDLLNAETAFGAGAMLVSDGSIVKSFSHIVSGYNPRSAIGLSRDGGTVYLVAVNGRQEESRGMTMSELATLMSELGCYNAANLDGGGSTNMVASTVTDGMLHTVNSPSEDRRVVNAVGITSDYVPGEPSGIVVKPSTDSVFIGQSVSLTSFIYDENNRPLSGNVTYSATNGTLKDGVFTATAGGTATINAVSQNAVGTAQVHVIDKLCGISVSDLALAKGDSAALEIHVFDEQGKSADITNYGAFEIKSSDSSVVSVVNGIVTAKENGCAIISVSKDGATAYCEVKSGRASTEFTESFEAEDCGSFASYPAYVGGGFYIADSPTFEGGASGCIYYDFTAETEDVKAAYFVLKKSVMLADDCDSISIYAYCENDFNHELKAQLTDSKGNACRIAFTKGLTGGKWQQLTAKIPSSVLRPLTLDRLYVVQVQGEDSDDGYIFIDKLNLMASELVSSSVIPEDKYTDSKCIDISSDFHFTVGALPTSVDRLIDLFAVREFSGVFNAADVFAVIGGAMPEGLCNKEATNSSAYYAVEGWKSLYISLNTAKGGIRASGSGQWDKMDAAIKDSDAENVFILSDNPITGDSEFENKVLYDYLAGIGKQVFVITHGNENSLSIVNGVRFFTLKNVSDGASLSDNISSLSYLDFNFGDTVTYQWKKLWQ